MQFFQNYTRTQYDTTTTPSAAFIEEMIDMASAEIDELTGRTWDKVVGEELEIDGSREFITLKGPVIDVTSVTDISGNALDFKIIDRDVVKLARPQPVIITYDYGYETVPVAIKMLTTLYAIRKLIQGASANEGNSTAISIGPLSITQSLGLSTIINLDKDVEKYEMRIRRFVR